MAAKNEQSQELEETRSGWTGSSTRNRWTVALVGATLACAAAFVGAACWNVAKAGREVVKLRYGTVAFAYPKAEARATVVANVVNSSMSRVDLSKVPSAVVYLYHSKCGVCALNVVNWARLRQDLAQVSPGTRVASLTIESRTADSAYWADIPDSGLEHWLLRDTAEVRAVFGVGLVPTTAVIENGVVVATVTGIVGPRRRSAILSNVVGKRLANAR